MASTRDVMQSNGNAKEKARALALLTASTAQEGLQTGLGAAQDFLSTTKDSASKNLKKAQKNLKPVQKTVQKNVQAGLEQTQDLLQSGLETAQDVLEKGVKGAGKGLKTVQQTISDTQDSIQAQRARAARKRAVSRAMFRLGLVTGIVAVLLFTPWPGSETRQRLGEWWQTARQNLGI